MYRWVFTSEPNTTVRPPTKHVARKFERKNTKVDKENPTKNIVNKPKQPDEEDEGFRKVNSTCFFLFIFHFLQGLPATPMGFKCAYQSSTPNTPLLTVMPSAAGIQLFLVTSERLSWEQIGELLCFYLSIDTATRTVAYDTGNWSFTLEWMANGKKCKKNRKYQNA